MVFFYRGALDYLLLWSGMTNFIRLISSLTSAIEFFVDKRENIRYLIISMLSGNNSVVECDLAKVEVAGSNPVSRSIFF